MATALRRARNAPEQYDDLAAEWWNTRGPFAALHWLAAARGELIPPPPAGRDGLLVDLGCGGGLSAPHVPAGYRHIGVDQSESALAVAAEHGIEPVRADVTDVPLEDGCADVVLAGELFEHVEDLAGCVAEVCRLLRPGGLCVFDTINRTWWAKLTLVTIGERMPGGPPPRIHDFELFVRPEKLRLLFAHGGVHVESMRGLQPHPLLYLRYLVDRSTPVRMIPSRSLAALYQGLARKEAART